MFNSNNIKNKLRLRSLTLFLKDKQLTLKMLVQEDVSMIEGEFSALHPQVVDSKPNMQ